MKVYLAALAASVALVASGGAPGPFSVGITISAAALNADTLTLHAYRLPPGGPEALSAANLVATVDVARGAPSCGRVTGVRTCRTLAAIPVGTDAIVAVLTEKKRVVGEAFGVVTEPGTASLAFDAGATAIANLVVVAPTTIQGRAFNVGTTAFAGDGSIVMLDPASHPIDVRVYGPAGMVPSPHATVGGSAVAASFRVGGGTFVNPMTVTAVAGTMSNTTQIYPHATGLPACAPLGDTHVIHLEEPASIRRGFRLYASVAGSAVTRVGLDTGSTSFAIAKKKISGALASQLIGPGRSAQVTYQPSGVTLYGNYYLAPVTLYANRGKMKLATTVPMEVFVVTTQCAKHQTLPCSPDTATAYMGVGFGRPSPKPPQLPGLPLMATQLEDPFMQLEQIVQGTMHPGFVLSSSALTIGLDRASAVGASFVALDPYPERRGDWQGPPACLRFNADAYQCGHMLVDIGIDSMFIHGNAPRPLDEIEIVAPSADRPLVRYSFGYPVRPDATPPAPRARGGKPVIFVSPPEPAFVNTGRGLLSVATFLYDAGCGRAGFRKLGVTR